MSQKQNGYENASFSQHLYFMASRAGLWHNLPIISGGRGGESVVLESYGDVIGPSGFIEICKKYRRGSYLKKNYHRCRITTADWDHSFSTYAKFSEKLTFLTPWYAHVSVRIRGWKM